LLRHLRPQLEQQFEMIDQEPPPPDAPAAIGEKPGQNLPSYRSGGKEWADGRVFFGSFKKVELKEIYAQTSGQAEKRATCRSLSTQCFAAASKVSPTNLGEMNHEQWGYRKALVCEIAYLAEGP